MSRRTLGLRSRSYRNCHHRSDELSRREMWRVGSVPPIGSLGCLQVGVGIRVVRTLTRCIEEDFGEKRDAPAGLPAFHGEAGFGVGVLFEQAECEAPQPSQVFA